LSTDISKSRNDILLVGPSTCHLLKFGSPYQILETVTSISLNKFKYIFFCVNNSTQTYIDTTIHGSTNITPSGYHWSLLFLNRLHKICYHFDSIKGINIKHASNLANNIAPKYKFLEIETVQQSGSFECGVHVIVNAMNLLNKLTNQDFDIFEQCVIVKKNYSIMCTVKLYKYIRR